MASPATGTNAEHMRRALELAEGGRGRVSPNPLVGAVLVRGGEVIGEGFHARLGDLHAERAALEDCRRRGGDAAGATLCVTLEPCAHRGRQPPCTEAILEAGVARVVFASDDPSQKASGRGPEILREAGVEVLECGGEEARAARLLNQAFRKHARSGRPMVTLKLAISLDGGTSTAPGDSRWISGDASRALVHRWRAEADAVAVGIGTVLADDPLLNVRGTELGGQPLRVVFDRQARLPLDSALLGSLEQAPLLVIAAPSTDPARLAALREAGAEVIIAAEIPAALELLGDRGITSVLLEGGRTLAAAFARAGEIDEARTFVAPLLLGDQLLEVAGAGGLAAPPAAGKDLASGEVRTPRASGPPRLRALSHQAEQIGEDTLITARFREW